MNYDYLIAIACLAAALAWPLSILWAFRAGGRRAIHNMCAAAGRVAHLVHSLSAAAARAEFEKIPPPPVPRIVTITCDRREPALRPGDFRPAP